MEYLEYHRAKENCIKAIDNYRAIVHEKLALFSKTQPSAVEFDKESVSGGLPENAFDKYLEVKEAKRIDARIEEAASILREMGRILDLKRRDLYDSQKTIDKIYRMKHIEGQKTSEIAKKLSYSDMQIRRYLKEIAKKIKDVEICC